MGTLTGNAPRMAEQCLHKLPTSCRLTATPQCCACLDKRAHSPTYSTYIDGVGMVSRGTRWQRYCWFCKEFWQNRVTLEGVDPKATQVPDVPDQSEFCALWFDYQRSSQATNRLGHAVDVREELVCEVPWRDTPPGYLPLRRQPGYLARLVDTAHVAPLQPHVSIEQMLDDLLDEEESPDHVTTRANDAEQQAIHGAHSGPQHASVTRSQELEQEYQQARTRLHRATARANGVARQMRRVKEEFDEAETELRVCRARYHQLTTARERARNFERVFGSREEFLQQGADYVSPLSAMFQRAHGWYQTAEEVRAAQRDSDRHEARYEQIMAGVNEPWLRQSFETVRQQRHEGAATVAPQPQSLDDDRIQRPPPKSDAEMSVSMSCKVCLQQVSDTAVLPCGHLVMCGYCAEIAMPTKDQAGIAPARRDARCLLCRKPVKRLAKIYLS